MDRDILEMLVRIEHLLGKINDSVRDGVVEQRATNRLLGEIADRLAVCEEDDDMS